MADLTKGLDDAKTLYSQYLQWVTMIESRTLWQGQIADHRSALQELRNRQAAVIKAEAIIETGVQSFQHWMAKRNSVPLIRELNWQLLLVSNHFHSSLH
jgi:hypothetical protein